MFCVQIVNIKFLVLTGVNTPYSKMAAKFSILLFDGKLALLVPFEFKYFLNFMFDSEVKRANLRGNKRILKWRLFWNKVY